MKPHVPIFAALASCFLSFAAPLGAEPIDMNNLPNYANQPLPAYISRFNTPPDNQISDKGAALGRVLFYDKALSINNTVSCATCHQQEKAFSDIDRASTGVNGTTGRHSMRLVNTRFGAEHRMFWDERADSVEDQVTQPIQDHAEMGFSGQNGAPDLNDLMAKMDGTSYYPFLFREVFGDPQITEDRMQRVLAQFVRSIQSFDSRYDAGRAQAPGDNVPFPNFTASENRGKQLFVAPPAFNPQGLRMGGGVGCMGCHQLPEASIDPNSRNNGVLGSIAGGNDLRNTRSPSLRDLLDPDGEPNGPFMHDASLTTLRSVVLHYNAIPAAAGAPNVRPTVDPRLLPGGSPQRLQLTEGEITDIIAFLSTMSGTAVYTDLRWSDPFDENGVLTVVGLSGPIGNAWLVY